MPTGKKNLKLVKKTARPEKRQERLIALMEELEDTTMTLSELRQAVRLMCVLLRQEIADKTDAQNEAIEQLRGDISELQYNTGPGA